MTATTAPAPVTASALDSPRAFFNFLVRELRPRPPFVTTFNVLSIPIVLVGLAILAVRFTQGLGSVTNLNQEFPWGFWIGFDVVSGVALAGGAYVVTFVVYVLKVERYHPIVRVTVLNGFLAYVFYAGGLVLDLGKPWNIINPIIGNSFGFNSVLFLVAWHFVLYMVAEFIEFSPAIAEWMGARKLRVFLQSITIGTVIAGFTISTLHQAGLGALFLMAKGKIHPLWYTEFMPVLFFVSSIFAGLSMVIVEGTLSHRVLKDHMDAEHGAFDKLIFGLARGAALSMFAYYFFKALIFIHEHHWDLMGDFWGNWYLLEILGLTLVPCVMFAYGIRHRSLGVVRAAAILALIGVILNRLNISMIAFNWFVPNHYYPSWQELWITAMIITCEIWVFRFVVTRMPVLRKAPGFD
jgi:Ni/Fe-hydrogenase subunit HybB-like protein